MAFSVHRTIPSSIFLRSNLVLFLSCVPVRSASNKGQRLGGMNMNPLSVRDTGDTTEDSAHNLSGRKVAVIAACVTSGVLLLLLVLALLWLYQRRRRLSASLPRTSADGLLRQGVEKGETIWRRPSYGSPPPRSEQSQWVHAAPQHQPQVWSSKFPQPPARAGEVEYDPCREYNDGEPGLAWSSAAQGVSRVRYAPAHTVPPPNLVVLRESFSGVHSRPHHSTRSVGQSFDTFDLPAQHNGPSLPMEAPQSKSAFETQPRPSFPRSLEPVETAEAKALAQPPSASTTRWPRFGFSSGVPDEYAASPHTATTNATWRRSFYVPWRQRTLSGPRDRGSMARDAKCQPTLSLPQPESALPTSAAHVSPETLPGSAEDDAQMHPADQLVIHDAPSTPNLSPSRRILPSLKVNTTLPPAPAFLSQQPVAAQKRIKRKPVSALLGLRSMTTPRVGAKLIVHNATSL